MSQVTEGQLLNPRLPESLDEAFKVANSLALWIKYIETNPLKIDDPMSSFGGHLEGHLATLNLWFSVEKVKALTRSAEASAESNAAGRF